jgi:hypothetical protein
MFTFPAELLKVDVILIFCIQTISGRPPPAASMAVGQFFNPEEGTSALSAARIIGSSYIPEVINSCLPKYG